MTTGVAAASPRHALAQPQFLGPCHRLSPPFHAQFEVDALGVGLHRVQLDAPPPALRETRGHLKIDGAQRSLLGEGMTHLLAVLLRESGF